MTSFWVVAGVFIVGALMFVLPTLWSKREPRWRRGPRLDQCRVYRDQLAELDSDLRSDILTREQYEQSKRELQQRMLQDIPQEETVAATMMGGNRNVTTITLTTLAVPLLAVSLYLWLGNTKALLPQTAAEHPAMPDVTGKWAPRFFVRAGKPYRTAQGSAG